MCKWTSFLSFDDGDVYGNEMGKISCDKQSLIYVDDVIIVVNENEISFINSDKVLNDVFETCKHFNADYVNLDTKENSNR